MADWKKHDAYKPQGEWDRKTSYRVMDSKWVKQDEVAPVAETNPIPDNWLTFSSSNPFTLGVYNATKNWDGKLYYSTDTETWNEWDGVTVISSAEHDGEHRIYVCGSGNSVITGVSGTTGWKLTGGEVRCEGNIESLLDHETVAKGEHPVMGEMCYAGLFFTETHLTVAPNLTAATLTPYCYDNMFYGCTSLTAAPKISAITMAEMCCHGVFNGCTSLATTPDLHATTLAEYCCENMFDGCTSLTVAPKLPATTLARFCYNYMFNGCTALTTAPELPATSLEVGCYGNMFEGCTSLMDAPALPATSLEVGCYGNMFEGCTSLANAPALPATTLARLCYCYMFYGCTSLTTIPELPATYLPNACYENMFYGCTSIKVSTKQTDEYQTAYRVPTSGTGTMVNGSSLNAMFKNTGGTFTGTPELNTTYYTSNAVV